MAALNNGLGGATPLPMQLGGGLSRVLTEQRALMRQLEDVLDTSDDTEYAAEAYAEAGAINQVWACNERLRNQVIPERMLESVVVWEESMRLRPDPADSDSARRGKIAAKMRGIANNAVGDLEAAARALLGVNFVALRVRNPANDITYWPGVNPGPPGYEWASNRARVAIEMSTDGLTQDSLIRKRDAVAEMLDDTMPAWMNSVVGVGSSFVINQGIVGLSII